MVRAGVNFANREPRNDGIDLIRGIFIISVILLHTNLLIPFNHSPIGNLLSQQIFNIIFRSGYYGVMIFFVVSGFLITKTSINRWGNLSNIRSSQFYRIRFARIAPCLIGLLVILSLLDLASVKGFTITTTSLEQAIFSALTFHINWLEAKTGYLPASWDVLWSLSVEEMFYIFFPLLCLLVTNKNVFTLIMITFIVLGPFARSVFSDNDIWSDHSYLSCMDGIAMGCLAALYISKFKINYKSSLFFFLTGLALFLFIFIFRKQAYHLGLSKLGLNVTVLEIGIAFVLIAMHNWFVLQKNKGSQMTALFRWFGRNSYEIYLTHMFVILIITDIFLNTNTSFQFEWLLYMAIIIFSGALGHLIAKYYSEPLNRILIKCGVTATQELKI